MGKQRFKRIIIGLKVEIISGDISCEGVIENLSENGIFVITFPAQTTIDFIPETPLQLNFRTLLGETLNLRCKVIWSSKTPPHGLTSRIGMEIIEPAWDKSNYFL
jgi:hypothetical protein